MTRTLMLLLLVVLASLTSSTAQTDTPALREALQYERLTESKALALIPGVIDSETTTHGQANDLMAAITALRTCEASRRPEQPACELRHLNDERITSGAEIRATVPTEEHPLYLWRLESPTSTVFLAGSVHILKPSLYPLPAVYDQAFAAADTLVVEVNVGAVQDELFTNLAIGLFEAHSFVDRDRGETRSCVGFRDA